MRHGRGGTYLDHDFVPFRFGFFFRTTNPPSSDTTPTRCTATPPPSSATAALAVWTRMGRRTCGVRVFGACATCGRGMSFVCFFVGVLVSICLGCGLGWSRSVRLFVGGRATRQTPPPTAKSHAPSSCTKPKNTSHEGRGFRQHRLPSGRDGPTLWYPVGASSVRWCTPATGPSSDPC